MVKVTREKLEIHDPMFGEPPTPFTPSKGNNMSISYELIAESLKITRPEMDRRERWHQWVRCVYGVGNFLRFEDHSFDLDSFVTLCGYEEPKQEDFALESRVVEYCRRYGISPAFKISEPFDVERDLKAQYPNSDSAGCYAVYTASYELLYIGVAANSNVIGLRLGDIWRLNADKTAVVSKKDWDKKPQIVRTIPVPVDRPYEALSLEGFLIQELQPQYNKVGGGPRAGRVAECVEIL